MIINILTIFPEMFPGPLQYSLIGQAIKKNILNLNIIDIRSFSNNKHFNVDDTPYGGGPGMIFRADVLGNAIDKVLIDHPDTKLIYMSPSGKKFNQDNARQMVPLSNITILCGRFEGIDNRVIEFYNFQEISIGDYILSGGELSAMVFIDTIARMIPGVVNNPESINNESFSNNLLEYPQYTKPKEWKNCKVPDILISGDHNKINEWRKNQAELITKERRPDLIE